MSTTDKNRNRLIALLKELFQLDQPELDFGLYKIMHAKSVQITKFLESDLLKEIELAFGQVDEHCAAVAKANYEEAIEQAKKFGAPNPEETEGVKEAKSAYENAKDSGNAESEIYDHLYRFFERYYDSGDFMSRRYYARESDSRAAPYSVPYDGREVYLHWANKDQYYIKSSEYLSNYTFELKAAIRQEAQKTKGAGLDAFATLDDEQLLKVHFRIIDVSEGEHGNIKATSDKKRFFLIHEDTPTIMDNGELVIQFEYRIDNDKPSKTQDRIWQESRLLEAEVAIFNALEEDTSTTKFLQGLSRLAPTDSKAKRTLLGKYLYQYTARNTMDYFIHKDLGGFMHRELDFYIKNEIMRLDDIENADALKVEQYLAQIRVLRRIAQQLISFLTQLEDFQKKLWLKKKFVTETNYCITLDRVPQKFYAEISANDSQHDEWLRLFSIDEIELSTEMAVPYSRPLSVDFLALNNKLVLDTQFFEENFKARLISSIENFEEQCDGLLIHSENFQALSEMRIISQETIKCIYIDPPYNTGQDEFLYKDNYQSSSWLCMLADRLAIAKGFLRQDGAIAVSIDENEVSALLRLMDDIFGKENRAGIAIIKRGSVTGHKAINKGLVNITEYLIIYALNKSKWDPKRAYKPRERNDRYNNFIKNYFDSPDNWQICSLLDAFAEYKGMPKNKLKKTLGKTFEDEIFSFIKLNAESVIQLAYPDESNVSKDAQEAIKESRKNKTSVLHFKRAGVPDMFLIGGQRLLFYKDRLVEIDGELVTAEPLSDIWDDILPNDLHNEGGVSLKKGKKPEKLLNRIYDICCDEKETVLDFFLGSGTTAATALKRGLKFVGVEQSEYFDSKAIERIKLVNKTKKKHEKEQSFLVKYLRLESYEDTLNNLVLKADNSRDKALATNADLQRDYLLNYFLDVETQASQSLLNIADFRDPTAYKMNIKKPGSDEQSLQAIDLIETFNWLIGLQVQNMAVPHSFSAEFEREQDPDLPKDQNTRLTCKRLKVDNTGDYWFRLIEGYTLKVPGDSTSKVATLIIWRKQTDDAEKDNAVLQKFLMDTLGISPREHTYSLIYINGSHTLPNPVVEGEQTKVRLIEEAFHNAMWSGDAS